MKMVEVIQSQNIERILIYILYPLEYLLKVTRLYLG